MLTYLAVFVDSTPCCCLTNNIIRLCKQTEPHFKVNVCEQWRKKLKHNIINLSSMLSKLTF